MPARLTTDDLFLAVERNDYESVVLYMRRKRLTDVERLYIADWIEARLRPTKRGRPRHDPIRKTMTNVWIRQQVESRAGQRKVTTPDVAKELNVSESRVTHALAATRKQPRAKRRGK